MTMEPIDKLVNFLKGNHTWTRLYKPGEITDPISKAIEKSGENMGKTMADAMESNKAVAKIQLGQGVELSLPITTQIKGEKGEKGEKGNPGKDSDEEKIIREVLKKIVLPKDGKDADEDRIVRSILGKLKRPKDGKDAVVDYGYIVDETLKAIADEYPGWKPMTEFEIREMIREAVPKVNGFTKADRRGIIEELKKEVQKLTSNAKNVSYSLWQRAIGVKNLDDVDLTAPTNGQALTYSNGKWVNATVSGGSGSPGGSDTQVQFNDGGAFGGDAGLVYNKTTNVLTVGDVIDSGLTASTILSSDGSKQITSLSTATYPSLTELAYLKGVTSAVQTQISAKLANIVEDTTPQLGGDLDLNGHVVTGLVIGTNIQAYDSDLTTIAGLTATTNNIIQSVSSSWASRTPTQVTATLDEMVGDSGAGGTKGLVPAPSTGDATKFLKGDGTWGTPAGSGDVSKVGTPADNQIGVWTGDGTIEGDANLTWSGSLLTVTNATDSASVQVAIFQGDRATNADNDEAYISLKLSDDGGTQKEVARVAWVGTDINAATSVDGRLDFYVMTAGTLASKLQLSGSSLYPTTNDGLSLGVGGIGFSDIYLASGGIVDFANSTLQLIHSSDTLRLSALSGSPIMEVRASSSTTSAAQCLITQNSTGDAFARFALSTTISYAIGVDNSVAGDPFKISTAASGTAALGTGDIFTLTSAGALTLASSVKSTSVLATSNDVGALGASGTAWSDLFLASGGVINWNAGNATLTHSAGLLTSNVPISLGTSNALTSGTIELGHASDTTIARVSAGVISVEGVTIPSISSTDTLTNKRITKRTGTTTSSATPTINTDNVDFYSITALATAITSFTTNLSGTPTEAQTLWIAITDNGTARAITWGSSFESSGNVTLPTTTVISTRLDVGFVWNSATSKFRCVAVA